MRRPAGILDWTRGLDKHGRVGQRGQFYDQDGEPPDAGAHTAPNHAGRGMLYDQDAPAPRNPAELSIKARRQRVLDQQREREIDLRRDLEFERVRQERRRRAREDQQDPAPAIRISSRPGDAASCAGSPWIPPVALPPPPPKAPSQAAPEVAPVAKAAPAARAGQPPGTGRSAPAARAGPPGAPGRPGG